eukprot:30671-Pelagococcus_subviridis.AAC.2
MSGASRSRRRRRGDSIPSRDAGRQHAGTLDAPSSEFAAFGATPLPLPSAPIVLIGALSPAFRDGDGDRPRAWHRTPRLAKRIWFFSRAATRPVRAPSARTRSLERPDDARIPEVMRDATAACAVHAAADIARVVSHARATDARRVRRLPRVPKVANELSSRVHLAPDATAARVLRAQETARSRSSTPLRARLQLAARRGGFFAVYVRRASPLDISTAADDDVGSFVRRAPCEGRKRTYYAKNLADRERATRDLNRGVRTRPLARASSPHRANFVVARVAGSRAPRRRRVVPRSIARVRTTSPTESRAANAAHRGSKRAAAKSSSL